LQPERHARLALSGELAVVQPVADGTVCAGASPAKEAPRGEGNPAHIWQWPEQPPDFCAGRHAWAWPAYIDGQKNGPQLNLDELQRLKWLLGGLLSLFSAWTVFYLDVDAWTLLTLNTVGIIAVLLWPRLPSVVPGWVHKAAFPLIVAVFLVDLVLSARGQVLPPMVRLDLMLIFYRATSYRQRRDDLQLIVLGLFLVVVAGVITVSLVFAVQIIAFTGCALLLLFVITLADAAEAQDPPARTPFFTWRITTDTPAWTGHGGWRHLLGRLRAASDWRVATLGVTLFAGVVVLSGLLFLAIPRFQFENSLFLDRFISKKAKTGFTDNISLAT